VIPGCGPSHQHQRRKGFHSATVTETRFKGRIRAESFADHYSQARQFYVSQTAYEQAHLASGLAFELSKVEHVHVREAMVGHLINSLNPLFRKGFDETSGFKGFQNDADCL
jgi:catalase